MASPRAPFDQGLFLTHFNKGKEHFDHKRYEEAERQLEEAYLLRPRDQKVLNLLGLIYFKQDKYEKAEEVYRKLATESPDAHTLFYNLGLIYFKLQRLEEAESAFLKALDLVGESPKINFYLGSLYERMRRFQDAIYQYRQAGANILVRRVEDKLAAHKKSPEATLRPPAATAGTAASLDPETQPLGEDTAKFHVQDIRDAIRRAEQEAAAFPGKPVSPVSPVLMAEGAGHRTEDTARYRVSDLFPGSAAGGPPASEGHPEIISFPPGRAAESVVPTDRTLPPTRRPEVFRFLENNLMEVDFSGKVFIKQGTIYSYSGNLTFWVKDKRPGGHPPLVMITGAGRVILTDRERQITFMHVQEETIYVEPSHLLACEATLTPRWVGVGSGGTPAEFLALDGAGMVALSVASKPLALTVTPEMPVSVPSSSVITWSGAITPRAVEDRQVYEVMATAGRAGDTLIRLEGNGRLLVEQSAGGR
jgi:uncharacterized protein (AIM24 family)/TolA-binding protein